MQTLIFATNNAHKRHEVQTFLNNSGLAVEIQMPENLQEVEETGQTFLENAILKAQGATGFPDEFLILAEDAGLVVPALAGQYGLDPFPGIKSNRWLTPEIYQSLCNKSLTNPEATYPELNEGLLKLLDDKSDRGGYFISTMVIYSHLDGLLHQVEGRMPLEIIAERAPQGENGFGYDPIARPIINGITQPYTVAQMSADEKSSISHRGRALQEIAEWLTKQAVSTESASHP